MTDTNRFKTDIFADVKDKALLIDRLECSDLIADDDHMESFFTKSIVTELRGGDLDAIAFEEASLELAKQLLEQSILTHEEIDMGNSVSAHGVKYYKRVFSLKHLVYSESETLRQNDELILENTKLKNKDVDTSGDYVIHQIDDPNYENSSTEIEELEQKVYDMFKKEALNKRIINKQTELIDGLNEKNELCNDIINANNQIIEVNKEQVSTLKEIVSKLENYNDSLKEQLEEKDNKNLYKNIFYFIFISILIVLLVIK